MESTILAKTFAIILEAMKWLAVALLGLLVWTWKKHDSKVSKMDERIVIVESDVHSLKAKYITKDDLDHREKKIMDRVDVEHQRIITTIDNSIDAMKDELITCNKNVMLHIENVSTDVREIREFMFNHIERRNPPRE